MGTVLFIPTPPPPPWHFGTPLKLGGGCLKRGEIQIIFFPRKIHFHIFFPIFLADGQEIFVSYRGGGVYSVLAPKSQIWALNRGCLVGRVFSMKITVYQI